MAQGLPYGFFKQALPVIMREQGASLPKIGLFSLFALPWALKFLWAPFIDRVGRRKHWIVGLQSASCFLFAALAIWGSSDDYVLLAWAFFATNVIAATQDIASDGMAVTLLTSRERGWGNGFQVAGYRVGMIMGGGFILMGFGFLGWRGMFFCLAAMLAVSTLPLIMTRELVLPKHTRQASPSLRQRISRVGMLKWLAVIGFFKFGDAMASEMLRPFFYDMGLGLVEVGQILGTLGFVSGLIGALVGGALVNRLGRYWAVVLMGVVQAIAVLMYIGLDNGLSGIWIPWLCAFEHFTGGMATAALFTVMMDMCESESAATDYSIQASFVVIATLMSGIVAGLVAEIHGYSANFLVAGLLSLLGAFWFAKAYPRLNQRLNPQAELKVA